MKKPAEFNTDFEMSYAYIGGFDTGESENYLYERLFNYTLCPETVNGHLGLPDVFYDTVYYQDIYKYCRDRGVII